MPFRGINLGRLQALCRPGHHDIAEVHDNPEDVRHLPSWLQVKSFLEANESIRVAAAAVSLQGDSSRHSTPRFSPSDTPNTNSNVSPLPTPGASETPNTHGAYTASGGYAVCSYCHAPLNHYIGSCPGTTMAHCPITVPQTPIVGVHQLCGYYPTPSNTGSTSRPTTGSGFDIPMRRHQRRNGDSGTMSLPGVSSGSQQLSVPNTGYNPRVPVYCLEGCPSHMSISAHTSFGVWQFDAVQVARSTRCAALGPVPAAADKPPNCRGVIETVRYLPASDDGRQGILPLPKAVPGVPQFPNCNCGREAHPIPGTGADNYRYSSVDIYLSSMEGNGDVKHFSDLNNKMHLNQMIELQLDVESLARRVAVALALMHWSTNIDANGVKFYLHSSWQMTRREQLLLETGSDVPIQAFTTLRVGGFDEAKLIKIEESGVYHAVAAVKRSPYIPRPNQRLPIQKRTWDAFVASYIAASDIILKAKGGQLRLPRLFIHQIIENEPNWK